MCTNFLSVTSLLALIGVNILFLYTKYERALAPSVPGHFIQA